MQSFEFFATLNDLEALRQSYQNTSDESLSAAVGQKIAQMTFETLKFQHDDQTFDQFWEKVIVRKPRGFTSMSHSCHGIGSYQKDCLSSGSFHSDPKSFYKQQYFEALDVITVSILKISSRIQNLSLCRIKACLQEDIESDSI